MKTLSTAIGTLCLCLLSCTTSMTQHRSSLDSRQVGYSTDKDEAIKIISDVVHENLQSDYLVTDPGKNLHWGAYHKDQPAANQVGIRLIPISTSTGHSGYGFEVDTKGPFSKIGLNSKIYRSINSQFKEKSAPLLAN